MKVHFNKKYWHDSIYYYDIRGTSVIGVRMSDEYKDDAPQMRVRGFLTGKVMMKLI